jgi:hypothetical protein
MSSDGPKNSQGFVPYPAHAGMTDERYFEQLLSYTNGEWTTQVANAWIRHASEAFAHAARALLNCPPALREEIEHEAIHEYMDSIRHDRHCPPALREAIDRHLRWRDRSRRQIGSGG